MACPDLRPAEAGKALGGQGGEADDAGLAARARTDPAAFAVLYERYLGPVYRYCYARLGSRQDAEDATGKVFARALAGLGGYRGGAFAAWLFRIAHNAVVDLERARCQAQVAQAADEPADRAPSPEEAAVTRAEREALRAALARLPQERRAVLELGLAGWPLAQIAAALGKSVPAVKMLRLRAVRELRAMLADG